MYLGKPFHSELDQLADTYDWAVSLPIDIAVSKLHKYRGVPLVCIGSGGSLTTAHFAAALHQTFAGRVSHAVTPLEATSLPIDWKSAGALLFTAGGGNPDALGCFRRLANQDVASLGVVCCRAGGAIPSEANRYPTVDQILIEPPSGKDGFLATNTLLATAVVLTRVFAAAVRRDPGLPGSLDDLLDGGSAEHHREAVRRACRPVCERNTLVVLHGPTTRPAAVDLESKFVEAALGDIQTADYRNFAHGRHHWLAKRGGTTGVLAVISDADRDLADRTLALLPKSTPVARISVPGSGPAAALAALVGGFYVTAAAGERRGIDPGDPGVPAFGRRLYHLNPYGSIRAAAKGSIETVAIERKTGARTADLAAGALSYWSEAYAAFVKRLQSARFGAVVFDYDGTLCDSVDRVAGLRPEVAERLTGLLDAGVRVGVATGRGKSVGDALRAKLPQRLWDQLTVGYYNGASIAPLSDSTHPDVTSPPHESLSGLYETLRSTPPVGGAADLTLRPLQLTLEIHDAAFVPLVWRLVLSACLKEGRVGAVLSTRSIDVLAPGVTKMAVVERLAAGLDGGTSVLCVGDRGEWPGNDFELLRRPLSLSVDEPSPAADAGWNLVPPGVRGAAAAAHYLDGMRPAGGGFRIRL